jgi:Zn-dependent peptidase ImmA (M78 family)/DNA-binding XRE family transcriptional regulator
VAVFNREMLTLARESRGDTQAEFSSKVGISQAELSKYETGVRIPSDELVRKMAKKLDYTPEFLYLGDSIRAFGSGCVYHRKRKSAKEPKLAQLLAIINVKRIQVKQLLRAVDNRPAASFEYLDIDEYQDRGGPAQVARELRALWHLPPGPIQNVVRAIEDAGGIVIRCNFETGKVDALSQWIPGYPPIFLINDAIPTDRLRFTLCHEIGHITMHRVPTESMEREADQFAAEFLMPAKDIEPYLTFINLPKLASLKPYWRVSMNALLYRAADLGTIDERRKSYLWFQMGKSGYRIHEPVEIAKEEPTLLKEVLDVHRTSLGYSVEDLEAVLCEPGAFADINWRSNAGGMRLVK